MLKKIGDSLPVITAFIIFISIMKQIVFYLNFNIEIIQYLGVSELAILIAQDLLFIALIGFCQLLTMNDFQPIFSEAEKRTPKYRKWKRIIKKSLYLIFVLLSGLLIYRGYNSKQFLTILDNLSWYFLLISAAIIIEHDKIIRLHFSKQSYSVLIAMMLIIWFELNYIMRDIKAVEHGKYNQTVVITDNAKYVSNDSLLYIGRTEKYLFFHSRHDSTNTIIPSTEVKKVILRTK